MPSRSLSYRNNSLSLGCVVVTLIGSSMGCRSSWLPRPAFAKSSHPALPTSELAGTSEVIVPPAADTPPTIRLTAFADDDSQPSAVQSLDNPSQVDGAVEPTTSEPTPTVPGLDAPETLGDALRRASDAELLPPAAAVEPDTSSPLQFDQVISSVRLAYPTIREYMARRDEASGMVVSALGNFDDVLQGHSMNQPLGFYETYRQGIGLRQPLWTGGSVFTGYRIGRGTFEPWYGERETNDGGEFKLGLDFPLLQGNAIDRRRTDLRTARIRSAQTEPELYREWLSVQASAAFAYGSWVAAGLNVTVQEELLALAKERITQINLQIQTGDVPGLTRIDNERLIASREIILIAARRQFGEAAVRLSMFVRDAAGQPVLPAPGQVPSQFPEPSESPADPADMIARALAARPELRVLQFDAGIARAELDQAINQLLPELNVAVAAGQDVGAAASSKRDKGDLEFEAGFYGEVPLQRRMARGKVDSLRAKLRQIDAKVQLTSDNIATEVQRILVTRQAAQEQIEQARRNLDLATQTLEAGKIALLQGEFTLPILNIYEQAVADARAALITATAEFFIADTLLQVATGDGVAPPAM